MRRVGVGVDKAVQQKYAENADEQCAKDFGAMRDSYARWWERALFFEARCITAGVDATPFSRSYRPFLSTPFFEECQSLVVLEGLYSLPGLSCRVVLCQCDVQTYHDYFWDL
jgi:hypothetical protein